MFVEITKKCILSRIVFIIFMMIKLDIFLSISDKSICVRCFEIIGEYFAAARTRSGAFLEQIITTNRQMYPHGQP